MLEVLSRKDPFESKGFDQYRRDIGVEQMLKKSLKSMKRQYRIIQT